MSHSFLIILLKLGALLQVKATSSENTCSKFLPFDLFFSSLAKIFKCIHILATLWAHFVKLWAKPSGHTGSTIEDARHETFQLLLSQFTNSSETCCHEMSKHQNF